MVTGQVSLAGMPPLITAQVLYGLQQRTRSGAHTRVQMLRLVVEDLRHAQADSVHATAPTPGTGREKRTLLTALARHAALALSDPETEKAKDVWELAVFGLAGRLTFTTISQPWLRRRPSGGPPTSSRAAAVTAPPACCAACSPAWCACRRACAAADPTTATTPPSSGAATSNRSCTG